MIQRRAADVLVLVVLPVVLLLLAGDRALGDEPAIDEPPEAFFALVPERDRDAARAFYAKHVDIGGIPAAGAAVVDDRALVRTHEIVSRMLAGRPDVVRQMIEDGMYLVIIGKDQVYTDIPEYSHARNKEYLNERVRGTGGKPTSFGEENLLSLPLDRYDDESIAVHEFCHTIDGALRSLDPTWRERRDAAYENAKEKGLYRLAYAEGNPGEYWAEICQAYFDCQRVNNWNHGPIGTREQLAAHDPVGYALVHTTFALRPEEDWRYSWLQPLPGVFAPPARLGVDPWYTKFTWAREFTVVGRDASDEALLAANETIRGMFAYRHDILKALIADGVRLAVISEGESARGLPEYRATEGIDLGLRRVEYSPETRLLVVDERDALGHSRGPGAGASQVIRLFAGALHRAAGMRPIDPEHEGKSPRELQQYELRVQRLDVRFDERVAALWEAATGRGAWRGTAAANDRYEYWIAGVLAYFDAQAGAPPPVDAAFPIATREALAAYDAELHALVRETMAYEGHVDWRWGW